LRDLLQDDNRDNWRVRFKRFLLDFDSRIDFGMFQAKTWARELFERYTVFMDRFHVAGWRRWYFIEPVAESLSIGTGLLVAMLALALPAFRETSDDDWVKKSELAVTFLDRYGNEVGSRGIRHNDAIPLDQFPDHLIKATLATEDRRFYEHFGIDIPGLFRAMLTNARAGGVVQGGSSISQQLAKNLFLTNERTIERKVKEAFLALWLEVRLPKNEILKLYLDRAYLGGGTYGVDAAAQFYFNKSARDVNLAEAAMLAGLFKAPSRFAPHINLPAARARANVVLDNLVEAGFMTEGQVFGARRNPAVAVDRRDERQPSYYLDWAFEEMKKLVANLPRSVHERVFVVRLALDADLQKHADEALENSLKQYGREYAAKQGAAVLMDVDGSVRAMVGGRDYSESQFNRATDAMRQPGSSFKPYVYATALMHGFKPTSIVVDSPVCIGNWCPKNYGGGHRGAMTLMQALVRSINIIPVKLSIALGHGNPKKGRAMIRETARKAGLRTPLPDTPSMPIGADEVTVLDHTGGYTMFPNLGLSMRPHAVLEVRTGNGELVWRWDRDGAKPVRVLPPQVAMDMNMMMNQVVEAGTARRAQLDGIKAAGKTGTTNAYRDAWFVGFTGNFVCGVWFGNDDYKVMHQMTGGSLPAMTWKAIMTYAHQGIELKEIPGLGPRPQGKHVAASQEVPNIPIRPTSLLTKRGSDVLVHVERLMDEAARALAAARGEPPTETQSKGAQARPPGAVASSEPRPANAQVRGN
jgi:penicillin-binding protein 1A